MAAPLQSPEHYLNAITTSAQLYPTPSFGSTGSLTPLSSIRSDSNFDSTSSEANHDDFPNPMEAYVSDGHSSTNLRESTLSTKNLERHSQTFSEGNRRFIDGEFSDTDSDMLSHAPAESEHIPKSSESSNLSSRASSMSCDSKMFSEINRRFIDCEFSDTDSDMPSHAPAESEHTSRSSESSSLSSSISFKQFITHDRMSDEASEHSSLETTDTLRLEDPQPLLQHEFNFHSEQSQLNGSKINSTNLSPPSPRSLDDEPEGRLTDSQLLNELYLSSVDADDKPLANDEKSQQPQHIDNSGAISRTVTLEMTESETAELEDLEKEYSRSVENNEIQAEVLESLQQAESDFENGPSRRIVNPSDFTSSSSSKGSSASHSTMNGNAIASEMSGTSSLERTESMLADLESLQEFL